MALLGVLAALAERHAPMPTIAAWFFRSIMRGPGSGRVRNGRVGDADGGGVMPNSASTASVSWPHSGALPSTDRLREKRTSAADRG